MNSSNPKKINTLSLLGVHKWQVKGKVSDEFVTETAIEVAESISPKKVIILSKLPISFSGESGELLVKMLHAIELKPDDALLIQLTDPSLSIEKQIERSNAKALLVFGEEGAQILLNQVASLETLRNSRHYYGEHKLPLVPSFHPQHLLEHPASKRAAYQDLLLIKNFVAEALTA